MDDLDKQFFCNICGISFSLGYEMADHFQTKEHREKAAGGNLDLLIEKFISSVKTAIDSNGKN